MINWLHSLYSFSISQAFFLHTMLGLIKEYVTILAMKNSDGFEYVKDKFQNIREIKLKEGVLSGLQINECLK